MDALLFIVLFIDVVGWLLCMLGAIIDYRTSMGQWVSEARLLVVAILLGWLWPVYCIFLSCRVFKDAQIHNWLRDLWQQLQDWRKS